MPTCAASRCRTRAHLLWQTATRTESAQCRRLLCVSESWPNLCSPCPAVACYRPLLASVECNPAKVALCPVDALARSGRGSGGRVRGEQTAAPGRGSENSVLINWPARVLFSVRILFSPNENHILRQREHDSHISPHPLSLRQNFNPHNPPPGERWSRSSPCAVELGPRAKQKSPSTHVAACLVANSGAHTC